VFAQGSPFNWDYYNAGAGFSYRFWNASYASLGGPVGPPIVPFGFGLSYTTWEYRNLTLAPASSAAEPLSGCDLITVSALVCNTGAIDSDEVSQACECFQESGTLCCPFALRRPQSMRRSCDSQTVLYQLQAYDL